MGTQTLPKLPTIDFTNECLKPGSTSWLLASEKVQAAFEEYGCFIASFSQVSPKLRNDVILATKEMFDLPVETKKQNISKLAYFGYLGKEYFPNWMHFESMGIEKATILEHISYFTNLMWPNGNKSFCETMHTFANTISELEKTVTKMIFERYGVTKYYEAHQELNEYLLRFNRYEPLSYNEKLEPDQIHGTATHKDMSLITILYQNEVGVNPLEVITKEGECIAVEIPPTSFIVMAGYALKGWSNGRIYPCEHRVQMKGDQTRYSIALFSHSTGTIEVPNEFGDDQHPLKFKSFNHFGLLRFNLTKEGYEAKDTIEAYCGV